MGQPKGVKESQLVLLNQRESCEEVSLPQEWTLPSPDKDLSSAVKRAYEDYLHVCKTILAIQLPNSSSELLFLEFFHGGSAYMAMVDSGAQINLMSSVVAQSCDAKEVDSIPIFELAGVNGTRSRIQRWISLPICINNGAEYMLQIAVFRSETPMIILGIPFLQQVKARVDFANDIMDTSSGPVMLYKLTNPATPLIHLVYAPQLQGIKTEAVTQTQREQVLEILNRFGKLWNNSQRGRCDLVEHRIRLTTQQPVVIKARNYCSEHLHAINQEIVEMLKDNVIRPSGSPYSSEVVMVKKKAGTWRMCVDYRKLNACTIPDSYPLPRIPELLRSVKDSKYFVALDLRHGYWQIPMDKEAVPLDVVTNALVPN